MDEETDKNANTTFEKFKEWVKKNGIAASSILISLGAVVPMLATSLQSGVKNLADGTYKFGKGLVNVLKKLGPIFSALGNVLLAVLKIFSNGFLWLSSNLWVLLVALVFFLWTGYRYTYGMQTVKRK